MEAAGFNGVIAAIATPFDSDGHLDLKGMARLGQYVLDGRCHAIMTCGGTGEFPHLSREEKKAVTENVAKVAKPAAPWKRFSSAKMQRRGAHAGIDSQFYPALCVGAAGIFCTACVAPRMMVEIDDAFAQGHHKKALAAHARIMILATLLSPETKDRELRAYE